MDQRSTDVAVDFGSLTVLAMAGKTEHVRPEATPNETARNFFERGFAAGVGDAMDAREHSGDPGRGNQGPRAVEADVTED